VTASYVVSHIRCVMLRGRLCGEKSERPPFSRSPLRSSQHNSRAFQRREERHKVDLSTIVSRVAFLGLRAFPSKSWARGPGGTRDDDWVGKELSNTVCTSRKRGSTMTDEILLLAKCGGLRSRPSRADRANKTIATPLLQMRWRVFRLGVLIASFLPCPAMASRVWEPAQGSHYNQRVRSLPALLAAEPRGRVWEPAQGSHHNQRRRDMPRSISRWASRFFTSSRRSYSCLPWTSASSTFTRPSFS
jgi:hypothetical protein